MKKILSWSLVIFWLIVIFIFSNMNSVSSNTKSKKVINEVIEKTTIKSNINENKKNDIIHKLNTPFRKLMHITEYLILSILVLNALSYDLKNKKLYIISFILCIIFSSIDEIHQLYVGRTGCVLDVFIDSIGILIGQLIYYLKKKI